MNRYRLALISLVILATSCLGQEQGHPDSPALILNTLEHANVSGALVFTGRCGPGVWQPDVPKVRDLLDYSGARVRSCGRCLQTT
jgi:hypothetical protein